MSFLPEDYKEPQGNYLKFQDGKNKLRVLSSAITGWEYWNKENKPIRSKTPFQGIPADAKVENGKPIKPRHFWAFVVYNYDAGAVQIAQITQKGIQDDLRALIEDDTWGDPTAYDLTITKSGSGFDTKYTVMPSPKSEAPSEDISYINLKALYDGMDPFSQDVTGSGMDDFN